MNTNDALMNARSLWRAVSELADWCAELYRPCTDAEAQVMASQVADAHGLEADDRARLLVVAASFAQTSSDWKRWGAHDVVEVSRALLINSPITPPVEGQE